MMENSPSKPGLLTRITALSLLVITAILWVGTIPLITVIQNYSGPDPDLSRQIIEIAAPVIWVAFAAFGTVILLRSSNRRIGWIILLAGFFDTLVNSFGLVNQYVFLFQPGGYGDIVRYTAWVHNLSWIDLALFFSYPFFFPDGSLPSRRWRKIYKTLIISWGGLILLTAFSQPIFTNTFSGKDYPTANPFAFLPEINQEPQGLFFAVLLSVSCVSGLACLIYRYRIADSETRQQIKWIFYVFFLILMTVVLNVINFVAISLVPGFPFDFAGILSIVEQFGAIGFLIATAFALFKYRLWDIDLIVNRTLLFSLLTISIAGIYILIVAGASFILPFSDNRLFAFVAAACIAVLFNPLRQRLQVAVNRWMFGMSQDPFTTLSSLIRLLASPSSPENTLQQVVDTIAAALKLPYAAIQLERDGEFYSAAVYGTPIPETFVRPLLHDHKVVGRLLIASRANGEPVRDPDRKLLEVISLHVSVVAQSVRQEERLRMSRQRLITTLDEERKRIRRDLHDELGPTLASIALHADTAKDLVLGDPQEAIGMLQKIIEKTQKSVIEIRQLVYGLRPSILDESGLEGAIRQHISSLEPGSVSIKLETIGDLSAVPANVGLVAYRIIQEATTNIVNHARATTCTIRLSLGDDLAIEIEDDGIGLSDQRQNGLGLKSMQDRAAEMKGSFVINSSSLEGTRIISHIPVGGRNR